ncbi:MAG: AAA family ATPase [Anaerolineae bacterium]|nr:AAA family ATPase [Anaerolineae bacterium]
MKSEKGKLLNILIVAGYASDLDWVQLSLEEHEYQILGQVYSVTEAAQVIEKTQVDIILADSSGEGVLETDWIKRLALKATGCLILVSATQTQMDFVREAMLAGASGFLLKPFDLTDLSRSIEQVYHLWLQRSTLLAETRSQDRVAAKSTKKAHSIALFSPKGGTGATTLAVNLAIALKEETNAPVLLVDADLRTADVDIFLSIFSKRSILDLVNLGQKIDQELLEQVITEHASGIMVLRGDPQLQFIDAPFESGQIGSLIESIISLWDGYVVINTSNGLDRWTVEVLDAVNTVLVVTTPELPALRVTRNFLDLAEAVADTSGRWKVVMNAYQGKKVLQTADIEASIHYSISATMAEDSLLASTAINQGRPLVTSQRKSPLAKDIVTLAQQISAEQLTSAKVKSDDGEAHSEKEPGRPATSWKRFSFWQSLTNSVRLSIW